MSSIELTQNEADALINIEKKKINRSIYEYPHLGGRLNIPLKSTNNKEEFHLDITRSNIKLSKTSHQNRSRKIIILVRLCIDGSPHRNPDGSEIQRNHIHIYREGYGDKWAYPIPDYFTNIENKIITIYEFMEYCNIIDQPTIQLGIFT
ncbi:MAG: hypothetical protein GWP19_08540 [Planctomycetia bacterium]|nr:hypothetical protein [Planctomycetia bacterium]